MPRAMGFIEPGAGVAYLDVASELAAFVHRFPAWTCDGEPCCWRHYRLGIAQMGRESARDSLLAYEAHAMTQTTDDSVRTEWTKQKRLILGIP